MKRIFSTIVSLVLFFAPASANIISNYIKNSDFDRNSVVSIVVKDVKNNKTVYKKNEKKLLNPASVLKLLTFGASYMVLGENYKFETAVYKDINNNLYLKLGADPLLSSSNLVELFSDAKEKMEISSVNNIYIDDSIIDKTPYPASWMQEDIWPNQRAITPYIIDKNYTDITIKRSRLAAKTDIIQGDDYKIPIINELELSNVQNYTITKEYGENSPIITFRGCIKEDEIKKLPVLNPEINFIIKLNRALDKNKYLYNKQILFKKAPPEAAKISTVSRTIEEISKNILYSSDNFTSEVVSKAAAAKYINYAHPAANDDMIKMFYDVFSKISGNVNSTVNNNEIKIADSSGVSRHNLLSADFIISALDYIMNTTNTKTLMPTADEGTLSNRLLFLKGNLRAKTGTLSNMSSVAGVLNTRKNHELVFAIIVQNSPKRAAVLKNFEDNIISLIYRKY